MGIPLIFMIWSLNISDKTFAIFNYFVYNSGITVRDTTILIFGADLYDQKSEPIEF